MTITVTPGINTDSELSYPIRLKGIKSDIEKLNIVLTMGRYYEEILNSTIPQKPILLFLIMTNYYTTSHYT